MTLMDRAMIIRAIRLLSAEKFVVDEDVNDLLDMLTMEINILRATYKGFKKERDKARDSKFHKSLIQECTKWWTHKLKQDGTPPPELPIYYKWIETMRNA